MTDIIDSTQKTEDTYSAPWHENGDLEINVIGVMLSVLGDARDWGPLDASALERIKTYVVSKIDDEISKTDATSLTP